MPAKQAKEGMGFELYVAAALKTELHASDGKTLDLRDFNLNVNPKTYSAEGTGAGYPITVDITADRDDSDFEYIIECKSSTNPDEILDVNDEQFLKAMLEFLAIRFFYTKMSWKTYYILATNFPVARRLISLRKNLEAEAIRKLSLRLIKFGVKEHKSFNKEVASTEAIVNVLRDTTFLQLFDQYLRIKMESDKIFSENFKLYSTKLKNFSAQLSGPEPVESTDFQTIYFMCDSINHDECKEMLVRPYVCHYGDIRNIIAKLTKLEKNGKIVQKATTRYLGYSVAKDIKFSIETSPELVAEIVSKLLSQNMDTNYCAYVVPGTFDVLIINRDLAKRKIKACFLEAKSKYFLDQMQEFKGLGSELKIAVASFVFSTYGLPFSKNCFHSTEYL